MLELQPQSRQRLPNLQVRLLSSDSAKVAKDFDITSLHSTLPHFINLSHLLICRTCRVVTHMIHDVPRLCYGSGTVAGPGVRLYKSTSETKKQPLIRTEMGNLQHKSVKA
jgi:hypothetical protein